MLERIFEQKAALAAYSVDADLPVFDAQVGNDWKAVLLAEGFS